MRGGEASIEGSLKEEPREGSEIGEGDGDEQMKVRWLIFLR